MGSSDLADYYQEVFNFTSSMSIKFSPLADALNQLVIQKGYDVDDTAPATWKYYLNLAGQYHPTDTLIYITSLDTQQRILFSPSTLSSNPRTAAAYVPGQPQYAALCALYPDQADLIKSIVYPVLDINSAISACDFTILAYGTSILEADEYDIILQTMQEFLKYIAKRWYFPFFSYEPYYTWTFWGLLWQQMIAVVLLARILAIRTSSVHSWHITQYLASYGVGDYSDVLSRTQLLFLYRNMTYIIANRGKQTNLVVLADNLLSGLGVGLYGLDLWQETLNGSVTCQLTPQLVPVGIPTKFINALPAESAESISTMEQRLYTMGTEVDIDADYLADYTIKLGTTPLNTMPTKLLELRNIASDLKFAAFLNHFLLDSLVYAAVNNLYQTDIEITEPITSTTLTFSVADALIFYSYCTFRALDQTPINIPQQYTVSTAFSKNPTIPTTLPFNGYTYPMQYFINPTNYLGAYAWPTVAANSPQEFTQTLSVQFLAAIGQIQASRLAEDTPTNIALRMLTDSVIVRETIPLNLTPSTTYAQWFAAQPETVQRVVASLDTAADPTSGYETIADLILSQLLPATSTFKLYGNFALTNTAYSKFKQLFVQLCSYNILFLDSDTTVETGIFLGKMSSYTVSRTISRTIDIPCDSPLHIAHHYSNIEYLDKVDTMLKINSSVTDLTRVSGGTALRTQQVVAGQHRMGLGPNLSSTLTRSETIVFNMGRTNRFYLSAVS